MNEDIHAKPMGEDRYKNDSEWYSCIRWQWQLMEMQVNQKPRSLFLRFFFFFTNPDAFSGHDHCVDWPDMTSNLTGSSRKYFILKYGFIFRRYFNDGITLLQGCFCDFHKSFSYRDSFLYSKDNLPSTLLSQEWPYSKGNFNPEPALAGVYFKAH